jgi:hypothetical protein
LKTFQHYFRCVFYTFFDALQVCHFSDLGANLGPKRVLLGSISRTLWGQAEPVKIVLSCGFWLGSEGWRRSQIDVFSEFFRVCLQGATLNDIFCDFIDFWCPLGGQFGTLLQQKSTTFSERASGCDFRADGVLPWYHGGGQTMARLG